MPAMRQESDKHLERSKGNQGMEPVEPATAKAQGLRGKGNK